MADFRYSKKADADLSGIAEYTFLNYGEAQARAYRENIDQSARTIANFPTFARTYTTRKETAFKRYNVGEHVLFFQPAEYGVFIVRVLHQRMDFDRHLD